MVLPKNNRPHTNSSCGACCFYEESGVKVYRRGPLSGGRTFLFSKGLPLPSGFARCLAFLCFRGDGTIRLRPDGDNAGYSGSCGGNRRVCPELRNENLPDGHEQHGERGPVTKPSMPKKTNPPSVDSSTRKSGSLVSRPTSSGRRMLSARPITVEPYASRMPPSQ